MADAADDAAVTRFSKCQEEESIEDVDRLAFLRIMTSSRSLGCCRSKTWQITSRIGACQACLHLMFMFTDVCACEISLKEVTERVGAHAQMGLPRLKLAQAMTMTRVMTTFLSARSQRLLSRPLSASMYTNFA